MKLNIGWPGEADAANDVEIVERKGLGHPDTICDAVAEHVSASLCRAYLERFGAILHHNVDKILLAAGTARPAFGGGEITHPIELYLGGRATAEVQGARLPVADIAVAAAGEWVRRHLPDLDVDRHLRIVPLIRPSSVDLGLLFARGAAAAVPLANDTSVAAGFAPLTPLERGVLAVERTLNAAETKRTHPEIGPDIKVMGLRQGARLRLTVSCAFVGRYVESLADYFEKKARVAALAEAAARQSSGLEAEVDVNAADDAARGETFLTVSGTSAEAGDDGEVGRGNRANGLITPYRPMTLEAAAGKNPVSHVGKLYSLLAGRIASAVAALGEGWTAECLLLSQIGRPIDDPALVDVRVRAGTPSAPAREAMETMMGTIVRDHLGRLSQLRDELVAETIAPY
jgi:S-adenosylmethionine synthetase